jgi:poly(3-hydroxybutyrate) depolymerase
MRYVILALVASAALARGITKESIVSGGQQRTYYLFVPEHPTGPLIVALHGSGRNGSILLEHWQRLAEKEGIVLAGLDSINTQQWAYPVDGPDFLRDVIEAVKAKVTIDPHRIYLFGHSAGAMFALQLSLMESEYFAATAIHAGALQPHDYPLTASAQRKIPIWMIVGTNDQLFPREKVRATRDELQKDGFPVELVEIPRHTHDYYSRSREINDKAWAFLSRQSLATEPKYLVYAK